MVRTAALFSVLDGGPALGGQNLTLYDDFRQIHGFPRLPSAHSVRRAKALRSTLGLAIAQGTTKSFSESDDVVDLQLKKTKAFLELQVDIRRRRGKQAMLFQPDAQQVRAARLLHRVRWLRVRFDHPPTPLNHGPISPCITLAMVHGCSPCACKASAMSWSAWASNVHSDQIRACEKVCMPATIGGN